jgi:hypothetical protein
MDTTARATDVTIAREPAAPVPRAIARERIAALGGTALLVAGILLVAAVLPAEFDVDPLGIGRRLGLTAIGDVQKGIQAFEASRGAGAAGAPVVAAQERPFQEERVEFTIAPRQFMEYKYRLDKGEALLYSWKATADVNYEFHAEPDGAPQGYAESYEKKNAVGAASGTLTAPFSGIHGWYWENPTDAEITVTLTAAGFYNMSHEFRKNEPPKTKMFQ